MVSRREFLTIGTGGLAAASLTARAWAQATAQTPKRGGTLTLRTWDPPHFDHILAHAYKTHVVVSFTHSRLLRHKAGAAVPPGIVHAGGRPRGVVAADERHHVRVQAAQGRPLSRQAARNGRELTAEDVRYTFERTLNEKGSTNAAMYRSIAKIEAVDKYTVKFTLKEPFAWFLDHIANPMAGGIIAKECVEKFGDLKKAEAVIGTGPWMLEQYKPNQSPHARPEPAVLHAGPAVHRSGRDARGRGQRLAHRGLPRRQVRPGLGVPRHHQPLGLGPDRRHAQEAAAHPAHAGVHVERRERLRDAHGQAAVQRRSRAPGAVARHRPAGTDRRHARGRGRDQRARSRGAHRLGAADRRSSARAPSTTSTIPPRPSGCSPRPASPTGSRPPCALPPMAAPSSSTRCNCCSRT